MASPYDSVQAKWVQRKQWAVANGIHPEAVDRVAAMDIQRVKAGGQPLARGEAWAELQSASSQQLATPAREHHGGLLNVLGNVGSDIGGIVEGLGSAAVHPTRLIRAVEKDPLAFVPGVTTGRAVLKGDWGALEKHPVGTFLDVAALAAPIAKLAKIGSIGEVVGEGAAKVAENVGRTAEVGGKVFEKGSVAEAAAKGQMARASLRAAAEGLKKLSGGKWEPSATIHDVASHYQLLKSQSAMVATYNDYARGLFNTTEDADHIVSRLHDTEDWKAIRHEMTPFGATAAETEAPGLSAEHKLLEEATRRFGEDPHVIHGLSVDHQKLVVNLYRNHGYTKIHGMLAEQGLIKTVEDHFNEIEKLPPQLHKQALREFETLDPRHDPFLAEQFERQFPGRDPEKPFVGLVVHKDMANLFYGKRGMFSGKDWENPTAAEKLFTGSNKLLKASIFFRPSMMLHMGIGQMVFMAGAASHEVFLPSNIIKAFRYAREGNPAVLAGGFEKMTTDAAHGFLASNTLGRMVSKVPDSMRKVTNAVTSMERAMVYIAKHDSSVADGLGEIAARQAGMAAVRDSFHMLDNATPFERGVLRQIFPFYGYHRHVIEYLARFPSEHPFRAEVLSHIGEIESKDMRTGLAGRLQQLLALGPTDAKGNVRTVDVSAANPFKSFANDFTIAGFTANLNPLGKILLQHLGVRTQTGTPELYPTLEYNPQTGTVEAARPSAGGLAGMAEAFVPQLGSVDAILGFNNRLKSMKTSDPSAYRQFLFSQVGIPIPRTLNVNDQMAKAEGNVYKVAQQDVSKAVKSGDFSYLAGYDRVPFRGRLVTPAQLEAWYATQRQQAGAKLQPGMSLKALIGR